MDRALFFLDGITFQKAGELFFETEATFEEQKICPVSYRRCVEDVAETLLFGKGLAVGRDLPEVAPGVLPCDYLRSYIGQLARPIDNAGGGGKPDDPLSDSDPAGKAEAIGFLQQLSKIVKSPEFVFWGELAIREARHVGSDSTLRTPQENPDDYHYAMRFNQNPELRSAVPREYLEGVIRAARRAGRVDNSVCDDALRVFFSENAATHLLTFCWYRRVITKALGDNLSLYHPHATRSAMSPAHADSYRLELPAILVPILRKADRPVHVLEQLLHDALKDYHRELGERAGEGYEYGLKGDEGKAKNAFEKVTAISRKHHKTIAHRFSVSRTTREYEMGSKRGLGAPVISPERGDDVTSMDEYEREFLRVFGPKPRSLISVPASPGPALPKAAIDRRVWYDHLADKFHYWKLPPERTAKIDKIRGFVDQFPLELRDGVVRMLMSVRVYSDGDFDFHYRSFLKRNPELLKDGTLVCPFDTSGGSAFLMKYMSTHSLNLGRHADSLSSALDEEIGASRRIVLLDDAVISGTQAMHIIDEYMGRHDGEATHVKPLSDNQRKRLTRDRIKIRLLFVLATESARMLLAEKIRAKYPELNLQVEKITQMDSRALFRDRTYIFGPMAEEARAFFESVGRAILEVRAAKKETSTAKQELYCRENAIGFGDHQLLIVYPYNVPKGTVTLLWESGNFDEKSWAPLFPIREPD